MFEESDALKFMRKEIGAELDALYSDDDLLNIVDAIWDYYEENGFLEIDNNEEEDDDIIPIDELYDYVGRMMKRDKGCKVMPEHMRSIIDAELAYEDSISNEL